MVVGVVLCTVHSEHSGQKCGGLRLWCTWYTPKKSTGLVARAFCFVVKVGYRWGEPCNLAGCTRSPASPEVGRLP